MRNAAPGAPRPAPDAIPTISPAGEAWVKQHQAKLADANLKKGLKLLWLATGKDDFLLGSTKATVELLKKHGFNPIYKETDGGHTWIKWRDYLTEFAPQLFN
jgi:enterochelin esterase family protein